MNKKDRQVVFEKYGGRCAYCGCELTKGWHVDHINPIRRNESDENIKRFNRLRKIPITRGENDVSNYNPACRQCNIWKSTYSVEQFRKEVSEQVSRLNNYNANYRNAKRYGLIIEMDIPVVFYFENFKNNT